MDTFIKDICGAKLSCAVEKVGYAHTDYTVKLHEGTWPSDRELITFADGWDGQGDNEYYAYFGGRITNLAPDLKRVTVHTD